MLTLIHTPLTPPPFGGTKPAGGKRLPTKTKRKSTKTTKTPYEKPQRTPSTTPPTPVELPMPVPTPVPPMSPHSSPTPTQPTIAIHTTPHDPTTDPTLTPHTLEALTAPLPLPTADAVVAPHPAPKSQPKRRSNYIEPLVPLLARADRSSRNACSVHDTRTVKTIPDAKLTRLPHLTPDTCSLAIGPSQQYDGGQELYLDQTICLPGTIIAYYEGTELSEEEKDVSTSRYVFKIPTGPDSAIFIDAEDPMSCYARYADDSFYDGTENAHWVETGTGAATRLALVATTTIKRGEPIRACYGWEYWFDPSLFTKALMTKAFRGYINYIKDDDEEAPKAWAYATHVDLQDLLLTA